jgi:hypothetical protein
MSRRCRTEPGLPEGKQSAEGSITGEVGRGMVSDWPHVT